MKKLYILILFVYAFYLINNVTSQCTYSNSLTGSTYDLSPIAKNGGDHYSVTMGVSVVSFNFCYRGVTLCGVNTANQAVAACQKNPDKPQYWILELSGEVPQKTDTQTGMTLFHKGSVNGGCATANQQREFYQFFNCNPLVDMNVTKIEETITCRYQMSIDTKYVCRSCPLGCSNHGSCDGYTGLCSCDTQTQGLGCEVSRLSINSILPSNSNGGQVVINGYFGTTTTSLSVTINSKPCAIISTSSSSIKCNAPSGTGLQTLKVIDRDLTASNYYLYTNVSCPLACFGHGTCNEYGVCTCDSQTQGIDCSVSRLSITSVSPVNVNGGTITINGYFGTTTSSLSITIGSSSCVITSKNSSSIICVAPAGTGVKVLKVIDGTLSVIKSDFSYTNITCPLACSNHGICNEYGTCSCDTQTQGTDCSVSRLSITSVSFVNVNGGTITINGYFGATTPLLSITIGSKSCVNVLTNATSISCTAPAGTGINILKVTDGTLSIAKSDFIYTNIACPFACSNHGICNQYGVCTCDSQTQGLGCEDSKLSITSITPLKSTGGIISIIGYFGTTSSLSIKIGSLPCTITLNSSSSITCNAPAGTGYQTLTVTDRDLSVSNYYLYTNVSCPLACSNHGICNEYGVCSCDTQTTGLDCSVSRLSITSVSSVNINGGLITILGYFGTTTSSLSVTIDNKACISPTSTNVSISCTAASGTGGTKILTITDGNLIIKSDFIYTNLTCSPVCSNHGICNERGKCECDTQTNGPSCSNSRLSITSTTTITRNGGDITIIGYFGVTTPSSLSVTVGSISCTDIISNSTLIKCSTQSNLLADTIQDLKVTVGDLSIIKSDFEYKNISCNECHRYGVCNGYTGICSSCNEITSGTQCSDSQLKINSVTKSGGDGNPILIKGYFGRNITRLSVTVDSVPCTQLSFTIDFIIICVPPTPTGTDTTKTIMVTDEGGYFVESYYNQNC